MTSLSQELQAARLRLVKDRPYLASAAWALQPVQKPGLGTMAVDMYWRLYFDPAVIRQWSVEELSGVIYHEISHLLRDHASRMKDLDRTAANIAADAEINDDLLNEGVKLPVNPITPKSIGQPNNLLAEEYYTALEHQVQQSAPSQGKSDQQGDGNGQTKDEVTQGDGSSSADHGSGEDNQPNPSQTAEGDSQADDTQPGDQGDASGSKAGDNSGSKSGDAGNGENGSAASSHSDASSGQPKSSSAQQGVSSQPPTSSGSGHGSGQDGREPGADGVQTPAPGAGKCGSCATGQQEPWEEGPPSEGASSGISQAEGELIRRDVARQIKEHSHSRGSIPGHWARWAEEKLHPKIDWRKELASMVRHAIADTIGANDYSYRRPSRRQGQIGNGKVVLPSLRRPVPSVAVVVDTSGSISDTMLAQALAEISGVLKGLGQREGVTVLAVDETVHTCKKVFRPEQVELAGGGGTDMTAGLVAASKLQPTPQVAIVITDGYTPWPDTPPRGMKVVVALTEAGEAPSWAKKVEIKEG